MNTLFNIDNLWFLIHYFIIIFTVYTFNIYYIKYNKTKIDKKIYKFITDYENKNKCKLIFISDIIKIPSLMIKNIFNINDEKTFMIQFNNIYKKYNNLHIILHTMGGNITSNDIMVKLLSTIKNKSIFVPYYACSAGTVLALTSNIIYMNNTAILSPTDPIYEYKGESYSVKSLMTTDNDLNDELLLGKHDNIKYYNDNIKIITQLQHKNKNINKLLLELTSGSVNPHNKPFLPSDLRKLGLHINTNISSPIQTITDQIIQNYK